jgi:hypothetical protein
LFHLLADVSLYFNQTEHQMLSSEEKRELHDFIKNHETLHDKFAEVQHLFTHTKKLDDVLLDCCHSSDQPHGSSSSTQDESQQSSQTSASPHPSTPAKNVHSDSDDNTPSNQNKTSLPKADSTKSSQYSSSSDSSSSEEDDEQDNTLSDEELADSQRSNRSNNPVTMQWQQPFYQFTSDVITQVAYFYLVIFALHSDSNQWLIKVGISRAKDNSFKERYAIYYRVFYYEQIQIHHCPTAESFRYYDAQQKLEIDNNQYIQKYKMDSVNLLERKDNYEVLRNFKIHSGESSGEIYYLGTSESPNDAAFLPIVEAIISILTKVAQSHYEPVHSILMPSKTLNRIKQLDKQMFDVSNVRVSCLATKIYRAGHFSIQHLNNNNFDFPLSITSVHNICKKFYENIKNNIFKCTWSDGKWWLRILWVGIGLAEESILLVLYFRQLGVFIYIVGIDLDETVIQQAQASVNKYHLESHFNLKALDVLHCDVNWVKARQIQIVYTSAVVDHIFIWKLYFICVVSTGILNFIAPNGQMLNLRRIQDDDNGVSFSFLPYKNSNNKNTIVNFCTQCEVATGSGQNSIDDSDIQHRPFKMVVLTKEMHNKEYCDEICKQGRMHLIELHLKKLTNSHAQEIKEWMMRTFQSEKLDGKYKDGVVVSGYFDKITIQFVREKWNRWLRYYKQDGTCTYALSDLRNMLKGRMSQLNMFCNIFPSNLIVSENIVAADHQNVYTIDDREYLTIAFQAEDHPSTRPINFSKEGEGEGEDEDEDECDGDDEGDNEGDGDDEGGGNNEGDGDDEGGGNNEGDGDDEGGGNNEGDDDDEGGGNNEGDEDDEGGGNNEGDDDDEGDGDEGGKETSEPASKRNRIQ